MLRCLTWKTARSLLCRRNSGQGGTRREEEKLFRGKIIEEEELIRWKIMEEEELFKEGKDTDTPL